MDTLFTLIMHWLTSCCMRTASAAASVAHPSLKGRGGLGGCKCGQISCQVRRRAGPLLQQLVAMLRTGRVRCCAGIRGRFARFQGSCALGCRGRPLGESGLRLGVAGTLCRRCSTACLQSGV